MKLNQKRPNLPHNYSAKALKGLKVFQIDLKVSQKDVIPIEIPWDELLVASEGSLLRKYFKTVVLAYI